MNLTEMTAADLAAAFRRGDASPVEAARAVLDRIDAADGDLNAYCLVDPGVTLAMARAAEDRWRAGEPLSALDGVPVSIKDIFLTTGWPTLRGSQAVDPDQPWEVDAPVTAALRAAGLVFTGKTTTPEIAWKAVTDSPRHGVTRNPADPSRTAGGSSGGAGAAVAAHMGPLAVGTDGGGSIRIPASFCGIVGLKPTHGLVPMFPASPFGPLAHAGPMTMTVRDAALLLDVLAVPDPRDPTSPAPVTTSFAAGLDEGGGAAGQVRAAYSRDLGHVRVDPEVAALIDAAVERLAGSGFAVTPRDPGFGDPLEAFEVLWSAGAATMLERMPGARAGIDPGLGRVWDRGEAYSAVEYLRARDVAAQVGITMGELHREVDVLLTPAVAVPPFAAGEEVPPGSGLERWPQWAGFSFPFNMSQQPAISVPVGTTTDGLPVGLQIVGPRHRDDLVLAVASRVEEILA